MGPSAVRWANTGATRRVRVPSQPIKRTWWLPRHSAAVLDWHSDKLFARSDSFVACLGRPRCFTLARRKLL
jgi:hypothetical protein